MLYVCVFFDPCTAEDLFVLGFDTSIVVVWIFLHQSDSGQLFADVPEVTLELASVVLEVGINRERHLL